MARLYDLCIATVRAGACRVQLLFQESSTESRACRCSSLSSGQTVCRRLNRQVAPVRVVSAATDIAHGLRCMLHCSKCQPVCWVQDCLKDKSMQSAYA